jgi:DNA-binding transcriptional LysR family regulator
MRPTTAQLETFYWVARLGSVKEAARHLHLAQPTISLRLQELEAQFRRPLFERAGRRLTLAPAGEALMTRAGSWMHELDGIRELIHGTSQAAGIIRVGLSETFAQVCLASCMRQLGATFPAVQLDITVGTSGALEAQVINRQLDLAFVINPVGDPKLAMIQLGIQGVTWAASPRLKLPRRKVTPAVLAKLTIITNPHPSPMYRQIIDWFREDGIEPSILCNCTSVNVATQLVRSGLGVSLLPAKLIESFLKDASLVRLAPQKEPSPSRLYCIYRFAEHNPLLDGVLDAARHAIAAHGFLVGGIHS